MKSTLFALVTLTLFGFTLSGCATIINGTTQKIPINTIPPGATAKNQDGVSCITPCSLELTRKQDHIITLSKEGFETQSMTCEHVLSSALAGNILLGGIIGAGVDAASGSMYRLTPESIRCELKSVLAKIEKPGLPIEKLKDLEELRKAGILSDGEYSTLKARVLEDFTQASPNQPGQRVPVQPEQPVPQVLAPEKGTTAMLISAASANEDLAADVNLFMEHYRTAYESADVNGFMTLYSKSAFENGMNCDDIRRSYQKNFEAGRHAYILKNPQIQKNDDNIILTGTYSLKKMGETKVVAEGNIRWTLVREDGALRIAKAEY